MADPAEQLRAEASAAASKCLAQASEADSFSTAIAHAGYSNDLMQDLSRHASDLRLSYQNLSKAVKACHRAASAATAQMLPSSCLVPAPLRVRTRGPTSRLAHLPSACVASPPAQANDMGRMKSLMEQCKASWAWFEDQRPVARGCGQSKPVKQPCLLPRSPAPQRASRQHKPLGFAVPSAVCSPVLWLACAASSMPALVARL